MKLSERLFVGVYPAGIVYADRAHERGGDYERLAFLPFSTLVLEVSRGRERHELMPAIRKDAEKMQARRGEKYQVSASGQYVVLGRASGRTSGGPRYKVDFEYDSEDVGTQREALKRAYAAVNNYEHQLAGVLDRTTGKYIYVAMHEESERGPRVYSIKGGKAHKWWREWIVGRAGGRTRGQGSGRSPVTGKQLFDEALPHISGPSTRAWAMRNRETFEQIAERSLEKRPYDSDSATRFATYITIRAMEG